MEFSGTRVLLGIFKGIGWLLVGTGLASLFTVGFRDLVVTWLTVAPPVLAGVGVITAATIASLLVEIAERIGHLAPAPQPSQTTETIRPRITLPTHVDSGKAVSGGGWPIGHIEEYRGHAILGTVTRVMAGDAMHHSIDEARAHIDRMIAGRA